MEGTIAHAGRKWLILNSTYSSLMYYAVNLFPFFVQNVRPQTKIEILIKFTVAFWNFNPVCVSAFFFFSVRERECSNIIILF